LNDYPILHNMKSRGLYYYQAGHSLLFENDSL
jgi:hypothetical protein